MRAIEARLNKAAEAAAAQLLHVRAPFYCSGCPHNTSTRVPEGSRAARRHRLPFSGDAMDRSTDIYTQMGGEGALVGRPGAFTGEKHIFANIGDGTYFHSGSLAIRQAIAAGHNITYKILYNDAVAMTGGQPVDGQLSVPLIAAQMRAEGVKRIAIVSDNPDSFRGNPRIPQGSPSTIARASTPCKKSCATSRASASSSTIRSAPPRSAAAASAASWNNRKGAYFINEGVCEGCGDCSRASNCLSIEPVETEFGRKRKINQSTCSQDFSCANGFCPSFVSVYGGTLKRDKPTDHELADLPEPPLPVIGADGYNVLMTGIGGLGITSLAAILGMAAHLHNRQVRVVDQIGLAQKGGGVYSHLRIGEQGAELFAARIGAGQADLVLAADIVVAHGKNGLPMMSADRTAVIADSQVTPTAEFVANNALTYDAASMNARLKANARLVEACQAQAIATALLGDAIYATMVLTGFAWQKGLIPLDRGAIMRAIELNGAAVDANKRAFDIGREAAAEPAAIMAKVSPPPKLSQTLDELIEIRVRDLTAYQDAAYAARYRALVEKARARERAVAPGRDALTSAVARNLYKLMAIKDEYEVARLYTDGTFAKRLEQKFEGKVKLAIHLAPPVFGSRNPDTGLPEKHTFGPWLLKAMTVLAKGKRLRGTPLDFFGRTAERKAERALIADYEARIEALLPRLSAANLGLAASYASVPDMIRGFGHVKAAAMKKAQARYVELEAALFEQADVLQAAE